MRELEASYRRYVLDLVIATRYVSRLLEHRRIVQYPDENHPEILKEFKNIISAAALEEGQRQSEPIKARSGARPAPSKVL
jgi:hypothetical protein